MTEHIWQLQEAKNRFSEVVNKALDEGPQVITRHGEEVAVLISRDLYAKLEKSRPGLYEFFRTSPLVGVELDLTRDPGAPRDLKL